MKVYSSIILVLALMLNFCIPTYQNNIIKDDYYDIVSKSFQKSTSELEVLNIQTWAQINKQGLKEKELLNLHKKIITSLGMSNNPKIDKSCPGFIAVFQNKELKEQNIYLETSIQSFRTDGQENGTYLGLLVYTKDFKKGREYYNILKGILNELDIEAEIGVTATGSYNCALNDSERKEILVKSLDASHAVVKEGINSEGLLSVSAYSHDCKDGLDVCENKINLNIAMRYHSLDKKTYIHIGAPVIYEEY